MGGLLILLLIFWLIRPGTSNRRRNDSARTILKVLGILFGISIFSALLDSMGGGLILLALATFFFVRYLQKEKIGASYDSNQAKTADYREVESTSSGRRPNAQTGPKTAQKQPGAGSAGGYPGGNYGNISIPYSKKRRSSIVKKFNREYGLTLSDEEISVIVEASYLSDSWKKEIADMNRRYESIYEWLTGDTAPIRVYIHAFGLQSISSDFTRQWQIAETAFDEIFTYADSLKNMTYEQRLAKVNEHFFTTFTDASFMIAYRFMQFRGHTYDIGNAYIPRDRNEDLAERMKKYDQPQQAASSAASGGSRTGSGQMTGSVSKSRTFGSDLDKAERTTDSIDEELKQAMSRYDLDN